MHKFIELHSNTYILKYMKISKSFLSVSLVFLCNFYIICGLYKLSKRYQILCIHTYM